MTYDGRGGATAANGLAIYIDGVSVPVTRNNNAAYVAMENLAAPLQIGRESPSWQQFDGALDEIRVWNVARTASAIQGTMSTELGSAEPGLVAAWQFNGGTGITAADGSGGGNTATLFNGTAWVAGGPLGPAVPDETPPVLSNTAVSSVGESSATVTFTTSEPATGWVSYSATGVCPCTDVYSAGLGTSHVVTMTGLAPATTYQIVVKASDGAGNVQTGTAISVTTRAAAGHNGSGGSAGAAGRDGERHGAGGSDGDRHARRGERAISGGRGRPRGRRFGRPLYGVSGYDEPG